MTDTQRLAKQLIYGGIYAILFLLLIYGFYRLFLKPAPSCFDNIQNQWEEGVDCGGPCKSCEINKLKPIKAEPVRIFDLNGTAALLEFNNPNPNYGANSLPYRIELYDDAGGVIESINDTTFVYPGERKFLIKNLDSGYLPIARAVITLGIPSWRPFSEFSPLNLTFRGIGKTKESNKFFVKGDIQNNETLLLPKIVVGASFYDKDDNIVSVSMTEVHDVKAFEERFFQIEHPAVASIDLQKTKLFFEAKRP